LLRRNARYPYAQPGRDFRGVFATRPRAGERPAGRAFAVATCLCSHLFAGCLCKESAMFSFASSQHLFWKEYRTQRSLWAAILLLALLFGVLLVSWGTLAGPSGGASRGAIFFAMLAFPPVYAWACGALLFAGEHDQETFDFLRA